jgi:hypothetical protein
MRLLDTWQVQTQNAKCSVVKQSIQFESSNHHVKICKNLLAIHDLLFSLSQNCCA